MSDTLLLTTTEVARLLHVSRSHVHNLIRSGDLPSIKLGKSRRIPRAALERWLEQQAAKARDET